MNNEIRIAFAKAIIDTIWMKGKISDEERLKSKAIIEDKLTKQK